MLTARIVFLVILLSSYITALVGNSMHSLHISMNIVFVPCTIYCISMLVFPSFRKHIPKSNHFHLLSPKEKIFGYISFFAIVALVGIWIIKLCGILR